jgi:hypothetical protein
VRLLDPAITATEGEKQWLDAFSELPCISV